MKDKALDGLEQMFYGHDACVMMLPQHVTCVSKFQECKGSLRAKVHLGSEM